MHEQDEIFDPTHPAFRLTRSPFYLIAHADFRYHEDVSAALQKHGVTRNMYRIMTVLRETKSASISYLAEHALIKRNTASRIIERMVEMDIAHSRADIEDSRVTVVELTPAGSKLLDKLTPMVARQVTRAMAGVSEEDLRHLVATLTRISDNLNKLAIE